MLPITVGLLILISGDPEPNAPRPAASAVRVEFRGKLRHADVAIGAETTGTSVIFEEMTWELLLPDDDSRQFVKDNHKERVTVVGSLMMKRGIERPIRWIVNVERIFKQDETQEPGGKVTILGNLRTKAAEAGSEPTFEVEAGDIVWPLDLSLEKDMPSLAESLLGKPVLLSGRVANSSGEKSKLRPRVLVEKLSPPPAKTAFNTYR